MNLQNISSVCIYKMIKSLCKVVPQGQIQEGVWGSQILCSIFGQVNILGFWIFFGNQFLGTPSYPPIYKTEPQGHKRSLTAHRACVGIKKNGVNYFVSLSVLDFDFFLVNNSWVLLPTLYCKKSSLKATKDLQQPIESQKCLKLKRYLNNI